MPHSRRIRLRYPAVCTICGADLPRRTEAVWDSGARQATCLDCADPADGVGDRTPASEPQLLDRGEAGRSGRRRHQRLRTGRETRARARLGPLGGLYLAVSKEPQSMRAWATGASGEEKLGAYLDELHDATSVFVLHDRRIPGSRANIDHLVITRGGLFVIDAKNYTGKVRKIDKGGWFATDFRLYVGRRDRSGLIRAVTGQVEAVRRALGEAVMQEFALTITPVLCFLNAERSLFARPFQLGGVWIERPKSLGRRLLASGPLAPEHVQAVSRKVIRALPSS